MPGVTAAAPQQEPSMAQLKPGSAVKLLLARVQTHRQRAHEVLSAEKRSRTAVEEAFGELRSEMVSRELATIPVARLRDSTDGRLRLGALETSGYRTVLDVYRATAEQLERVNGVGWQTATQARAAANQVAAAVSDGLKFHLDLDPSNKRSTQLLIAINRHDEVEQAVAPLRENAQRLAAELAKLESVAAPASGRLSFFFAGKRRKDEAQKALARLQHLLDWADDGIIAPLFNTAVEVIQRPKISKQDIWRDFEKRSPEYYGALGQVVDLKLDVAATEGFLPADIVARVQEQQLDESFRQVSLRGYQSFGARFALVQRRVILGDEMGLGKTIQAIAAIAHLKALGVSHFLVVCPASVLINWMREVSTRSKLRAYRLHGNEREVNLKTWVSRGDVAVTTFDTLRTVAIPADVSVGMLVVDEAHFAKNPNTQRSRYVDEWTQRAQRVLFMTGTPMENRVEEFRNLVNYLQPLIARKVEGRHGIAGADVFRKAVAPVYLRRNQEDVLTELPDLVQVDEWEEFGREDFRAYRAAVASGNFMAMRRAAFASVDSASCAKLVRLLEIADEAGDNGHKVVVFSYFRDVLESVSSSLGSRAHGPLTGAIPLAKRQRLVDEFSNADGHAVLVSQIQAGGVGLNLQAASVVVLCEPQVKPTMESQAVARAHRMGQVRPVQVHRLLIADSVDQRMLEILNSKTRLFDAYARRSDIAAASPDAVDISEIELAKRVVAMEQERLALQAIAAQESATGT